MNIITAERTYATFANAEKHLSGAMGKLGGTLQDCRYVIATTPEGRFAPVVVRSAGFGPDDSQLVQLAWLGVTVVG